MEFKGIRYVGPMFDASGYAQACRGYILALHKLGVPITLDPISFEELKPSLGKDEALLKSLVNRNIDYDVVIVHSTPEHWSRNVESDKVNIGYCVWETDKLHPDWPAYINDNVQACMVSCEWSVDVYKNSGITVPVFSVPHGIEISEFENIPQYKVRGVKDNAYKFYSIFQFIERKNPMGILKAYWHAFQRNENVALILKTYRMNFSEEEKSAVRETIKRMKLLMPMDLYPPIYLVGDMLSRNEVLGLHKGSDCLISLDRGEGFGLVPFEAGACGNPIIVTGMGGVTEFAKPYNSYLVQYTMTPVFGMPQFPWYRGDQKWAEPDLSRAAELMHHVFDNREEAIQRGMELKQHIAENFSWEKVGIKMLEVIKSL
jgi:glycosyltransferase involved in cell wall biosynthesis